MIALATASIVAMLEAAQLVFSVIGSVCDSRVDLRRGPYFMGESKSIAEESKFQLLRTEVLVPTDYGYSACVTAGLKVLFSDGGKLDSPTSSDIENYQQVQEAPGYWLAISRSVLRSTEGLSSTAADAIHGTYGPSTISNIMRILRENKLISFLNIAATIGDVFLKSTGGSGDLSSAIQPVGPRNVDLLPDGPATTISKSRSGNGLTALSLAWRGSNIPGAYLIPRNVIHTAIHMGTLSFGTNPLRGMMTDKALLKKTYLHPDLTGANSRIPGDIVERMENMLDAEYVPFYFHDIRTNEIIAFHAFLTTLSDTFAAGWTDVSGYGRMDPAKIYKNTTRSIQLSFYIVSTSKEDFNEMWWKINKLTTLVYPQWSEGTKVITKEGNNVSTFIQPFSQVLSASPLIRLRVGDVVKSNYSKFNLARIFGIGNDDIEPRVMDSDWTILADESARTNLAKGLDGFFYTLFGSPLGLDQEDRVGRAVMSQLYHNGFANPLGLAILLSKLRDPDAVQNPVPFSITAAGAVEALYSSLGRWSSSIAGYGWGGIHYLRASIGDDYIQDSTGLKYRIVRPLKIMITGWSKSSTHIQPTRSTNQNYVFKGPKQDNMAYQKTLYTVIIFDLNAPAGLIGREFHVSHADIIPNPTVLFNTVVLPAISLVGALLTIVQGLANAVATATGIPADTLDLTATGPSDFMKAEVNPIVKSFNSTRGRGLAGVIKTISYDWLEFPWEIDWNSRAPKGCKVTLSFDPIHDIPPGLDYSGYNRAPLYNVGDIMETVAGDPYDDDGFASRDAYTNAGRLGDVSNSAEEILGRGIPTGNDKNKV